MTAPLDYPALIEYHDLAGLADGREPVGDDEHGPLRDQSGERGLDQVLGFRVNRRGGLIQDQDGRVVEQCSGDRDSLFLPT